MVRLRLPWPGNGQGLRRFQRGYARCDCAHRATSIGGGADENEAPAIVARSLPSIAGAQQSGAFLKAASYCHRRLLAGQGGHELCLSRKASSWARSSTAKARVPTKEKASRANANIPRRHLTSTSSAGMEDGRRVSAGPIMSVTSGPMKAAMRSEERRVGK